MTTELKALTKLEIVVIVYGGVCTFVALFTMSGDLIFSAFMLPSSILGVYIGLLACRSFMPVEQIARLPILQRSIGASIMPITLLVASIRDTYYGELEQAGLNIMLLGFFLLFSLQYFLKGETNTITRKTNLDDD